MESPVKVDRRVLRTKQAIKKAFLELFAEKRFEDITINDIADRADINRGTVYLHYMDKFDLLDKCIEDHVRDMISRCGIREGEEADQATIRDSRPVFAFLRDHFAFFSAICATERAFLFRDKLQRFVTDGFLLKRIGGERETDAEAEVNAQFLASAFIGIVEWWIRRGMPHREDFMAEQVRRLFEKNVL